MRSEFDENPWSYGPHQPGGERDMSGPRGWRLNSVSLKRRAFEKALEVKIPIGQPKLSVRPIPKRRRQARTGSILFRNLFLSSDSKLASPPSLSLN